ncbi:hypothetical protein ROLI_046050 (plasmid) [Roseobacter fucihabitans]|uniref:FAD dependent oxidoreductase domain-containing protein n=1 Tax=Roseobacter fucihabitans TaxID=1537242 RepID=A0ABZ2C1N7_9RHOB|nr:FAD-dependent oxidoreductase [Roseobacter litoralis]MBC6966893.1 hydroxyglutarate oxidase [Roseobacter litoralis]
MGAQDEADIVIVGGGFFGCCLALFLRSVVARVVVIEAAPDIMSRASRVNQARVHTGYHYPRNMLTAVKSMVLHKRFMRDFPEAIITDLCSLYAVAHRNSKVSEQRFFRMFHEIGADITPASPGDQALFDPNQVAGVYECSEYAFDYAILQRQLMSRMDALGMDLRLNTTVQNVSEESQTCVVTLSDGREIRAGTVFNVTYAHVNQVLCEDAFMSVPLKHEIAEIVLVEPPEELTGKAVTLMDGPFFSMLPYPARDLYSLTHVRYTPHLNWRETPGTPPPYDILKNYDGDSKAPLMIADAKRYMPCLAGLKVKDTLFDVKTVLVKNERDDGRPILFHRAQGDSRVISVLGGKIDNIYDLFELVRTTDPCWAEADARHVIGSP